MSWDEAFADRYDEWSAAMTEDIPFYVALAREADGPVVELAVGSARVAAPVARALGRTVIGIDSSPAMLEQARATGADLDLRLGDVRELELDEPAALIYCPFRSLLHLHTWADRRRVFERVADCAPAGRTVRLERVRVRPRDRGAPRRPASRGARPAHGPLRGRGQSHRPRARRRRHLVALVGDEERVARPDRRRGARARGALRRVRAGAVHGREPRVRLRHPQAMSKYDAIARLYDPWSRSVIEDVGFYVELARQAGGPVVELGVGTGRIAIPTAAAGVHVIGVDSSRGMLEVCAEAAATAGVAHLVDLRVGDLADPPVRERVALVTCPFRAYLHLHTDDERLRALRAARELLLPGRPACVRRLRAGRGRHRRHARPLARARAGDPGAGSLGHRAAPADASRSAASPERRRWSSPGSRRRSGDR